MDDDFINLPRTLLDVGEAGQQGGLAPEDVRKDAMEKKIEF